ncbi:MAG: hypothetical protein ABI379_00535, partial [Rhodanobacter sp.]
MLREPGRIKQRFRIALAAIAQQGDDAAPFATFAHCGRQAQTGNKICTRRSAVAMAKKFIQHPCGGDRGGVRYLDDVINHVEQKAWFHPWPAD